MPFFEGPTVFCGFPGKPKGKKHHSPFGGGVHQKRSTILVRFSYLKKSKGPDELVSFYPSWCRRQSFALPKLEPSHFSSILRLSSASTHHASPCVQLHSCSHVNMYKSHEPAGPNGGTEAVYSEALEMMKHSEVYSI